MSADKRKLQSDKPEETSAKKLKLVVGTGGQTGGDDVRRMRLIDILNREIEAEISSLKDDLETIEDRIFQTKQYLMKVRQGIVSEFYQQSNKSTLQRPLHPAVKKVLRGKVPSYMDETIEYGQFSEDSKNANSPSSELSKDTVSEENSSEEQNNAHWFQRKTNDSVGSEMYQFVGDQKGRENNFELDKVERENIKMPRYIPPKILEKSISKLCQLRENTKKQKIRIVIGNVSKWLTPECQNATHKWTVYIKSLDSRFDITTLITKVKFFLHPSYKPNDVIQVERPPFKLTRRGWGEFPLRVQLQFVNSLNKPIDLIHHLKLDQTRSGMETFGCETVADLWLHLEDINCDIDSDESFQHCKKDSSDSYNSLNPPIQNNYLISENDKSVKQDLFHSTLAIKDKPNSSATEVKFEDNINDFYVPENIDKLSYLTDFSSVFMDDHCLKSLESLQLSSSDELALNNDTSSAIDALCSEVRFEDIQSSLHQISGSDFNSESKLSVEDLYTYSSGSLTDTGNDTTIELKNCDTDFEFSSEISPKKLTSVLESFSDFKSPSMKTETIDNITDIPSHIQNLDILYKPSLEESSTDKSLIKTLNNKIYNYEVDQDESISEIKSSEQEVLKGRGAPAANAYQIECSENVENNLNACKEAIYGEDLKNFSAFKINTEVPTTSIDGENLKNVGACKINTEVPTTSIVNTKNNNTNSIHLDTKAFSDKSEESAKVTNIKNVVPSRKLFLRLQNGQLKEINARVVVVPAKQQITSMKLTQPTLAKLISESKINRASIFDNSVKTVDSSKKITHNCQNVTNVSLQNQEVAISNPKEFTGTNCSSEPLKNIVTLNTNDNLKSIKPLVLKSVMPCAIVKSNQSSVTEDVSPRIVKNGNSFLTQPTNLSKLIGTQKNQGATEMNSLSISLPLLVGTVPSDSQTLVKSSKIKKEEPALINSQSSQRNKSILLKNSSEIEITIQDNVKEVIVKNVLNKCHGQNKTLSFNKSQSSLNDHCINSQTLQFPVSKTIVLPTSSSLENKTVVVQKKVVPGVSLLKKSIVKPESSKNCEDFVSHVLVNKSNCNDLKNCPSQDIESAVSWLMKCFPVVDKRARMGAFKTKHPYCAPDEDSFLHWPLPKQRAAEWLRAKTIARLLPKICISSEPWKTIEILKWARLRGYTPIKIESDISPVYKPNVEFVYTPQPDIKDLLEDCKRLESEEYVDVLNISEKKQTVEKHITLDDVIRKGGSFVPLEAPLRGIGSFIQRHCEKIKCHLGGEEIIPGIFHPSSLRLMISVFTSLAEDLTRRSYEAAWNRYGRRAPPSIEDADVKSAILSRTEFDLFTHEGEGAPIDSLLSSDVTNQLESGVPHIAPATS